MTEEREKIIMRAKNVAKGVCAVALATAVAVTLAGCGGSGSGDSQQKQAQQAQEQAQVTYDSIIEDYTPKIEDAGATAVEGYEADAKGVKDANELATTANEKVTDIAAVMTEGGTKLAELMAANGDEYSVYDKAYKELYKVYNDQAMEVYKAYMDDYAGLIPGMTRDMKKQMLKTFEDGLEQMAPEQAEK